MRTYGILDIGLAAVYTWIGFSVVPSRALWFKLTLSTVIALMLLSGVSLLLRARWSRLLGIVASSLLLGFAGCLILGLVSSAAYLRGVYGPLGRGMAIISLCAAAIVVELFALLPLFQLRFHLRK